MPGWHEATRELQAAGRLHLVGIVQEQHAERCRLFMQWKRMDWPVLVDSLGLTGTKVVPVSYLLDEAGVVRAIRPDLAVITSFAGGGAPEIDAPAPRSAAVELGVTALRESAVRADTPEAWRRLGDALFLTRSEDAVDAFRRVTALAPDDGPSWFRLGVALRRRYEQDPRPGDFQAASAAWTRALELEPDQYVWRRRLQQYGPLMDKPYPFYDWVDTARAEVRARGDVPAELTVEPRGSELAGKVEGVSAEPKHPDPTGRVPRDVHQRVAVEATVVPARILPGGAGRLHLVLRPARGVHWNDEASEPSAWLDLPSGWRRGAGPARAEAIGSTRVLEVDLHAPADDRPTGGAAHVTAVVFYDVCLDADGTCLQLRQDVAIEVPR